MSFAELVIFVDGVGYSLAARSRDEMFMKKQCGIYFWKSFSDFLRKQPFSSRSPPHGPAARNSLCR